MEGDNFDEQKRDKSVLNWLPDLSAACSLGSDRYLDKYLNFDYPKKCS